MTLTPIDNNYVTPEEPISCITRHFPTAMFYYKTFKIVCEAGWRTRKGYSSEQWAMDSRTFMRGAESCGLRFIVENTHAFANLPGPCVVVANHMSSMETFCLPYILGSHRPIAFVIKKSLTSYPVFRHVVNANNPIPVGRANPREDFATIMELGQERLSRGFSVIIFPQTTRTPNLNRHAFNSIGIKLAKKAGVPILPLALKTDAWGVGNLHKDYGQIRPEIPVRFCFGEPLTIHGTGKNEHEEIMEFIHWKIEGWRAE